MRGEHIMSSAGVRAWLGSSPHAWGTPGLRDSNAKMYGIIPACAGNTRISGSPRRPRRDHPRMRGEHYFGDTLDSAVWGSSPHARGTLTAPPINRRGRGIIPACAGNTIDRIIVIPADRDHPRMRGEHKGHIGELLAVRGSSPHARGTRFAVTNHVRVDGIIPACAGNTCTDVLGEQSYGDHPRMRGEHHYGCPDRCVNAWIIPACAGNTQALRTRTLWSRDHPRMRGEHSHCR